MLLPSSLRIFLTYRLPSLFRVFVAILSTRKSSFLSEKTVVFIFTKGGMRKRIYTPLLFMFHDEGYRVRLKFNLRFFSILFESNDINIFKANFVHVDFCPGKADILIADDINSLSYSAGKRFLITDSIKVDGLKPSEIAIPYLYSPTIYFSNIRSRFCDKENFSKHQREVPVCFVGNVHEGYDREDNKRNYSISSRFEVYTELKSKLLTGESLFLETWESKERFLAEEQFPKVFLLINSFLAGLTPSQYQKLLLQSECFLCLPGLTSPFAHHISESISCGCIPILQYPSVVMPGLLPGKTCFSFSELEELPELLRHISLLPRSVLAEMRVNLWSYFEKELSSKSFVYKIASFPFSKGELLIKDV